MAKNIPPFIIVALIGIVPHLCAEEWPVEVNRSLLAGKSFEFRWEHGDQQGTNGIATLREDGRITGIRSANESTWLVDEEGRLTFRSRDGTASTVFETVAHREGLLRFEGPFLLRDGIVHFLSEVDLGRTFDEQTATLNERIRTYSSQQLLCLDLGEEASFFGKKIRLVSVEETRDRVIDLVRSAMVVLEIDGRPHELACDPYTMPREIDGWRIRVDTTSAWSPIRKRVQLSIWQGPGPLVNTETFGFPLQDYRFLSHGTQGYGEVVHLGLRDGGPEGQRFYHDYGFDMAGYEARTVIVSCTDGKVLRLHPAKQPWSVLIQDEDGLIWDYGHLDSFHEDVKPGADIRKGQIIGILGKTGPSGNFAHLHLGAYLSLRDVEKGKSTRRLNLYPWLMTAWRSQQGKPLVAVARPHHTVRTGERVALDGSKSMADTAIASYRWELPDRTTVNDQRAEMVFRKPGVYVATLCVEDEHGIEDFDFCTVKVFAASAPEPSLPTIFMTREPGRDVLVGEPTTFRFWLQASTPAPIRVEFGDGRRIENYKSYDELRHTFDKPGIHIVRASATVGGIPTTCCLKVLAFRENISHEIDK